MSVDSDIVGAVHAKVRHDSARGHVTGEARYIDDMPLLPGTLEVVLVTSPHPHAGIVSIDVSAARSADGVRAVMSADDIPGVNDVGPVFEDEPVLAAGFVDYVGAPVVAIAADSYDQARNAAALVAVEYDVRPAVLEIEQALEQELYTYPPQFMTIGEPEAAIAKASHRIDGEVRCGGQDHFYLSRNASTSGPI